MADSSNNLEPKVRNNKKQKTKSFDLSPPSIDIRLGK
ncbi:hypothetical protein CCACVL1_01920 [Corchorus capsularis]|uniref:Uncharacterized protein n=1 Tax=Corchorus capsularis TaxID=210143 RepID=A0A1R3KE78_COCAP|nr:hypothetical protein CCACVL1_01920 [Corchorus capsularis]